MKKGIFFLLLLGIISSCALVFSSSASSDYFAVERKLMAYDSTVENKSFQSYQEVTSARQPVFAKDWEKTFAELPKSEWLYILPHGEAAKYQPLVDSHRQGYAFVLDTLYYVNADGWITVLDVATRAETPLFKAEGFVKEMKATVDLLFYECAGQLYRYHIPSGQKDFFMTVPAYGNTGWNLVSNQTVSFNSHWKQYWYNREEDQYYSAYSKPQYHTVSPGNEGLRPAEFVAERTALTQTVFEIEYDYLIRRIPFASYLTERVDFSNFRASSLLRNDDGILRQELDYLGWIDLDEEVSEPYPEKNPDMPRIPAAVVKQVYESVFGQGAFASLEGKDIRSVVEGHLYYDQQTDEYRFMCYTGGGGDGGGYRRTVYTDVVEKDGVTEVYVRFATAEPTTTKVLFHPGMSTLVEDEPFAFALGNADYFSVRKFLDGEYDAYLPLYKVTLRENEDGSYRWESTEPVEEGKASLSELFPASTPSANGDDYEAFFSKHRNLTACLLGSKNKAWSELVLVTPDNAEELKSVIVTENNLDLNTMHGFWYYGRNPYNKQSWQYMLRFVTPYDTFGQMLYYERGGILYSCDLDYKKYSPLHLVGDGVEDIHAFRDLIFFRRGDRLYRYYIPLDLLEEVATLPEGAQWSPASNRDLCFTTQTRTYWYDIQTKTEMDTYSGPEIITVTVDDKVVDPNADTSQKITDTDKNTEASDSLTEETDASVDDVSTGSVTDGVSQEEGSSAVWIVVAVVAVAAVAAAAVFFVLKKKKA